MSHIVCPVAADAIPSFKAVVRIGYLEIRKQIIPPSHDMRLDISRRDVLRSGIDANYEPTVKRRF